MVLNPTNLGPADQTATANQPAPTASRRAMRTNTVLNPTNRARVDLVGPRILPAPTASQQATPTSTRVLMAAIQVEL